MTTQETAALVRQIQEGDQQAFDRLFAAYQQRAVRTAALITGDPALAEDVAQETFVACLLHIQGLQDAERFRPWFFKTLTRCAWKAMDKKRQLTPVGWTEAVERAFPPTYDTYPSEEGSAYDALYRALDGLGKKQRTTVILYYFNDLSIREIARATGTLEATVKTRLFAAKQRLKQALEQEDERQKGEMIYEKRRV